MIPRVLSKKHLDFIRSLPCIRCGDDTATEAAHVRRGDMTAAKPITGMGTKPHDMWTMPLCGKCHRLQHEIGEREFWNIARCDPIRVAPLLFSYSVIGDREAAEETVRFWQS